MEAHTTNLEALGLPRHPNHIDEMITSLEAVIDRLKDLRQAGAKVCRRTRGLGLRLWTGPFIWTDRREVAQRFGFVDCLDEVEQRASEHDSIGRHGLPTPREAASPPPTTAAPSYLWNWQPTELTRDARTLGDMAAAYADAIQRLEAMKAEGVYLHSITMEGEAVLMTDDATVAEKFGLEPYFDFNKLLGAGDLADAPANC
jgi:hypothetical protein